jgi:hypothetical protein
MMPKPALQEWSKLTTKRWNIHERISSGQHVRQLAKSGVAVEKLTLSKFAEISSR